MRFEEIIKKPSRNSDKMKTLEIRKQENYEICVNHKKQ